jgi:predicted ATPase/class 3 adenylate cyclase/DNA-binding CsgD family transcriptional regulator
MSEIDPRADMSPMDWSDLAVTELLPTGTVTLLLADVEGSTRLWETLSQDMTAAVAALDRTVSAAVAAHGGIRPVEQGEGDSFVVAFTRASDAVACALELQRAPLAPIRLRIGVHTGEVQLRDEGNYIGPTINRTARLRDLAHGGQTVLSGATEEMVFDRLPPDTWLTDVGSHELRGVSRPERVVQLCHPNLQNEFPPLRTTKTAPAPNLPAQLTSFVGRRAEISDLRQTLADNRLVTLTGAGGAGKTRLAVQVAAEISTEFGEGVWYVDLAPITHPDLVPVTVARALGLPDQPRRSTMDTLTRFVGEHQMLVVLDNCEHLLDACAELVGALLGACPGLTLLATSREPIGVAGEATRQVPSLSLADEAIELFADRANRARSEFRLTDDNARTVEEICRRLDGMPLAIELAAARVRALSLDDIVGGLHDRFRLLTGGARTAVRRQQTLRASVDWSHALLTEPERILFRRLAVFLGGFDLNAAEAVAGDAEVERYQVLDLLALLVDKSLVLAENTGGPTRYRLLETLRQYALEKLGESGEADIVRSRHRDHYTATAAALDTARSGHVQLMEQAENEIDNLRSAFGWSLEESNTDLALRLASSLQPLWLSRGRAAEGLAWFDAVFGDTNAEPADVARAVRARALADRSVLDAALGGVGSMDQAQEALSIARELDDPALLTRALAARGGVASHHAEDARPYLAEAMDVARELGDRWILSQLLAWEAYVACIAGEPVTARSVSEEGLKLADEIGDGRSSRHCRWTLSMGQMLNGDLNASLTQGRALIADAEAAHDSVRWIHALFTHAYVLMYLGDCAASFSLCETAATAAPEFGAVNEGLAYAMRSLAAVAAGDVEAATEASEAARQRLASAQPMMAVFSVNPLAEIALARGDLTAARELADEAVCMATGWFMVQALTTRARVAIAQDEHEQAERDLHEALARASNTGAFLEIPNTLECLARTANTAGRHREAARLFGAADAMRQRTGEVRFAVHQADYNTWVATLRDAFADNDFQAEWAAGAALSTQEAVAYAQRGRGKRKRSTSGWGSLTPTELDVVRLVRDGLSNKDIGTRLFISPRTVQTHLTHVYTKLGLSTRVQLVQEAAHRA